MTPHKHAELIKAWADGAEIQCKQQASDKWMDICRPNWSEDVKYRIKPRTIKYRLFIQNLHDTIYVRTQTVGDGTDPESWESFTRWLGDWQEVEV